MNSAIRGAITVDTDNADKIDEAVKYLFDEITERNSLDLENVSYILFTITPDLRTKNPAASLRKMCGISDIPLFCCQEPVVINMMEKVIRMLVVLDERADRIEHVYLRKAKLLRPDISGTEETDL